MKVKFNWKAIFVGVLALLVSTFLMFAVADKFGDRWKDMPQATSMMPEDSLDPDFNFNELVDPDAAIRQPWNTFSSLYYVFVGAMLICLPYTKKSSKMSITSSKSLRILYGASIIITGLGSAFMHMSATFIGQFADVLGMYLISVFIVMYALRNIPKYNTALFSIAYIVINAALLYALWFAPNLRRNLFLVLILVGLVLECFCNRKAKGFSVDLVLAAASSLGLAYVLWLLDNRQGMFFERVGWFQGHSFWHLLGAVACGVLYLHYSKTYKAAVGEE